MYVYKQRCDVLPDTLWCSTTGVHACGVRSEYDKNIARYRYTSRERAISPAYHAQKLSPEINVVLVIGLKVFTQYGLIRH